MDELQDLFGDRLRLPPSQAVPGADRLKMRDDGAQPVCALRVVCASIVAEKRLGVRETGVADDEC